MRRGYKGSRLWLHTPVKTIYYKKKMYPGASMPIFFNTPVFATCNVLQVRATGLTW